MTATTTEAALRHAIAAHPCDDTPVLVWADYLEDLSQYDPSERERARDARLVVAHRNVIRNPDDVGARLAWVEVAEIVPEDEAALAEVRRELKSVRYEGCCDRLGNGLEKSGEKYRVVRCGCRRSDLIYREAALMHTAALHRRAEYVRVQCELHAMDCHKVPVSDSWLHNCRRYGYGTRVGGLTDYFPCAELRKRERDLWLPVVQDVIPASIHHEIFGSDATEWSPCTVRNANAEIVVARGFIEHLTCSAEQWFGSDRAPGLCERLWWDAGQTVSCGACGGRKGHSVYERGEYGPNRYFEDCPACRGEGKLPRPIPTTAVPLRRLTLTTAVPLRRLTLTTWPAEELPQYPGLHVEIRPQ